MFKNGKMLIGVLALALLTVPQMSYADWDRHGGGHHYGDRHSYRYHDRPSFGFRVSWVPEECHTVWAGPTRYYYYDGLYYNSYGREYVVVAPPVGAIVRAIPTDYQAVNINGVIYYTDNGTYYVYTRYGYQVVNPPVQYVVQSAPVVVQPTIAVAPPQPMALGDDAFTVNVPNDKGGYVAVSIKKSGNGFVGPQGEFYSEFPKVTQLKAMYVK